MRLPLIIPIVHYTGGGGGGYFYTNTGYFKVREIERPGCYAVIEKPKVSQ